MVVVHAVRDSALNLFMGDSTHLSHQMQSCLGAVVGKLWFSLWYCGADWIIVQEVREDSRLRCQWDHSNRDKVRKGKSLERTRVTTMVAGRPEK